MGVKRGSHRLPVGVIAERFFAVTQLPKKFTQPLISALIKKCKELSLSSWQQEETIEKVMEATAELRGQFIENNIFHFRKGIEFDSTTKAILDGYRGKLIAILGEKHGTAVYETAHGVLEGGVRVVKRGPETKRFVYTLNPAELLKRLRRNKIPRTFASTAVEGLNQVALKEKLSRIGAAQFVEGVSAFYSVLRPASIKNPTGFMADGTVIAAGKNLESTLKRAFEKSDCEEGDAKERARVFVKWLWLKIF